MVLNFILHETATPQVFQNIRSGAVQPCFHGSDRPVDSFGDLVIRLPLFVEENEDLAVILTEALQCYADTGCKFTAVIRRLRSSRLYQIINRFRPPASLSQRGSAAIHRDSKHPWLQGPFRIPTPQASEDSRKDFLCDILGVLCVPQKAVTKTKDVILETFDEFPHRGRIAIAAASNEFKIGRHAYRLRVIPAVSSQGFAVRPVIRPAISEIAGILETPGFLAADPAAG